MTASPAAHAQPIKTVSKQVWTDWQRENKD